MDLRYSRLYYQTIKCALVCLTMSIIFLFSISLTIQIPSLPHFNQSRLRNDDAQVSSNQISSPLTYRIEQTNFYPHLPIQIYTNNRNRFLQLPNKTKKLLLLANPMFEDATWSMKSLQHKTNSANMSELYCSFLNHQCEITNDLQRFQQADAVVYHLRDSINRSEEIMKYRHPSQRFVFTLWEPPINTPDLHAYNDFFNWTMTYRFDSHIFASYYPSSAYRLRDNQWLKNIISDYQVHEEQIVLYENIPTTKKKGTAAALISNCGQASQQRWSIIMELQKYIDVTVYGKCGHPCPTSTDENKIDCRSYIADHYYFLLSFENSLCQDYITEKFFSAIQLPIIPVVYGRMDYTRFIPSSGFIDVRHYSSISDLASHLDLIRTNRTLYQEYFHWKRQFIWGGFSTYMTPFCDLCLRLHLDQKPNVIHDVHAWWYNQTCQSETSNTK